MTDDQIGLEAGFAQFAEGKQHLRRAAAFDIEAARERMRPSHFEIRHPVAADIDIAEGLGGL